MRDPLHEERERYKTFTFPEWRKRFDAWTSGGELGSPPPRPVPPHIPGPMYPIYPNRRGFAIPAVGLWILLAGAIVAAVVSYGNARASSALAGARRDSIGTAYDSLEAREIRRQAESDSLLTVINASLAIEDSLEHLSDSLRDGSETNLERLETLLARPDAVPDTVRIIIREAIAGLDRELGVCEERRSECEVRADADSVKIFGLEKSGLEKDVLLVGYRRQLDQAIRTSIFDSPIVRFGERAAALYGIVRLVLDVVR